MPKPIPASNNIQIPLSMGISGGPGFGGGANGCASLGPINPLFSNGLLDDWFVD